jgi:phage terminase large subunit
MNAFICAPGDKTLYRPEPKQKPFFDAFKNYRYVWFAGGQGAGKTVAGAVKMALTALSRPGGRFLVGRWSYKELLTTAWDALKRIIPREAIIGVTDSPQNMSIVLRNGAVIYGWNLSNWQNMTSLETDAWWIEEGHELPTNEAILHLTARNRGKIGPRQGWVTGTPNGFDWEYDLFVRRGLPTHTYIQVPSSANRHLPPDYVPGLQALYTPEMRARFLRAEFTHGGGLCLHPWDPDLHVVDPFPIPDHWFRYRGLDPGYSADEAACLWMAVDTEGNQFVYDEYYQRGRIVREIAQDVLRQSRGQFFEWTRYDPLSGNQRNDQTGHTQAEVLKQHGMEDLLQGDPRVEQGIVEINELLRPDPNHTHPLTGKPGSPRTFVFSQCRRLQEEAGSWKRDKRGRPGDRADHLCACWRYLVLGHPMTTHPRASRHAPEAVRQFWQSIGREATEEMPVIGAMS